MSLRPIVRTADGEGGRRCHDRVCSGGGRSDDALTRQRRPRRHALKTDAIQEIPGQSVTFDFAHGD